MFTKDNAKDAFRDVLPAPLEALDMAVALRQKVDFFMSVDPDGALPEDQDGDMLLFEWGTFDWGQGPAFNLGLRRQIIYPDGALDHELWQLALNYTYDPRPALKALDSGEEWCISKDSAADFKTSLLASPVVSALRSVPFQSVDLTWEAQ